LTNHLQGIIINTKELYSSKKRYKTKKFSKRNQKRYSHISLFSLNSLPYVPFGILRIDG